MKKVIRLTEGDLRRIVKESTKRVLKEINSITADSAFVKARDAYNKMAANGQENTPQAQKLLRQMNTFRNYNDWDFDTPSYNDENWEEKAKQNMNTPNQYGNTPSKYLTDYANAYGMNNFDPLRFMKTDRQYERNGDKYDYNNMSQADMNMHQKFSNTPAMQADTTPSRMKSPEQLGLSYGGGKKGFLGFGKKSNQWVGNPNPNQ